MLSKEEKVIKEELKQLLVKESARELFFKHNNKYPDPENYVEDKVLRSFEKDILQILPFIYEKIISECANQKSIEFAEWLSGEGYQQYEGKERWIAPQNNNNVYETKQLYEMFLKQSKE